jgi:hypothetical protein
VERPELGRGEELGMSSDGIKRWRLGNLRPHVPLCSLGEERKGSFLIERLFCSCVVNGQVRVGPPVAFFQ